jgi:hypothetical protein
MIPPSARADRAKNAPRRLEPSGCRCVPNLCLRTQALHWCECTAWRASACEQGQAMARPASRQVKNQIFPFLAWQERA